MTQEVEFSWETLLTGLREIGLNHVGVAAPNAEAEAVLPGCTGVVVFASAGPALWHAFVAAVKRDPQVLTAHAHPLDQFIASALRRLDPAPSADRLWVRCAFDAERFVDFRPLAFAAGLGWPSRLGLLMDDEVGPWMGLRAACFVRTLPPQLHIRGPRTGPSPCEGCAAPCVSECPAGALAGGFRISACADWKQQGGCVGRCAARNACPVGATHRYPPLAQAYHDDRLSGRRALAAALGISHDPFLGEGPYWSDWASLSME